MEFYLAFIGMRCCYILNNLGIPTFCVDSNYYFVDSNYYWVILFHEIRLQLVSGNL